MLARLNAEAGVATATPSKYGNKKVTVDGIRFDSKAEARRYVDLRHLERAGEISHLVLQPEFPIMINGVKVAVYRADFSYRNAHGSVCEDVKGMKTPLYRLKKKLVEALYPGTKIVEVTR